jgi:catechol 2,3-dioxygenase-like lactoylglutathione lyase family enzyme
VQQSPDGTATVALVESDWILYDSRRHRAALTPEDSVDAIIDNLVGRFERGGLTRRQLIQGLSMLVAAAGASPADAAGQAPGLRATGIDHVSVLVGDMQRSADFYQRVFGLSAVSEDKPNRILRLGMQRAIVSLRQEPPAGLVDHYAIAVEKFNRESVTQVLKQHGLTPQENLEFGFHVKDPDGVNVQIV